MDKWFNLTFGLVIAIIFFGIINTAFGEDYVIEINDTGFHPTNSTIYHNDSLKFVSNSTSNWIIKSEQLLGGQHVIDDQGTTWNGFNSGNFTVALHKNYGDNLDLTPFTLEIIYLEPEPIVIEQEPIVEETFTPENPPENTCGFTGWQQEGNRNVAYRCGEEVASYIIDNPSDNFVGNTQTEHQQTLDLKLQILKVIESIFSLIFG